MSTRNLVIIATILIGAGFIVDRIFRSRNADAAAHYRIAILEPASHPAMDEIVNGFEATMKNNAPVHYVFDRYNANGNKTLLRSQAEEIIQRNYDLIMSIGADPTRTLHELTSKKHLTTPIVFTAVSDPVGLGVITSRVSSGNNITGVEEVPDYEDQINQLLSIKPMTKSILLVYDPAIKAGIHEVWAQDIQKVTDAKHIALHRAKVFHANEISSKVQALMPAIDVVMILTDHTTVSGIDSLITLCNRYGVTLYASDLNSGDKGAALSYGSTQYDLGVDAARLALKVLVEHLQPADIPVIQPEVKRLKINRATMNKQGLNMADAQLQDIVKNGGIIVDGN